MLQSSSRTPRDWPGNLLTSKMANASSAVGSSNGEGVLFLLDHLPRVWTSLQELEFRLCRALKAGGVLPILVFSEDCDKGLKERFESAGAVVVSANYGHGTLAYFRHIRELVRKYHVRTIYIDSFPWHGPMPWMARLSGVRRIIHTNGDGGVLRARSWKKALITLRNVVMSWPTTRIITWSQFVRRQMVGVSPSKIELVYGGIDTARFAPDPAVRERWVKRFAIPASDVIIAHIAFLKAIKRPQIVIQACSLLKRSGVSFQLFMAGDGEMKSQLEDLCQKLAIEERVHWLGKWAEPESLLQASDIFVLASVGEAFGFVTVEAMACGVPVVGTGIGATGELVEEGITGLLAAPDDASSFATALGRLAKDATLRREMAKQGPEVVRQRFTVDTAVENVMKVFEHAGFRFKQS